MRLNKSKPGHNLVDDNTDGKSSVMDDIHPVKFAKQSEIKESRSKPMEEPEMKILIETKHYTLPHDLSQHLDAVVKSPDLYRAHVQWRTLVDAADFPRHGAGFSDHGSTSIACQICEYYASNMMDTDGNQVSSMSDGGLGELVR